MRGQTLERKKLLTNESFSLFCLSIKNDALKAHLTKSISKYFTFKIPNIHTNFYLYDYSHMVKKLFQTFICCACGFLSYKNKLL